MISDKQLANKVWRDPVYFIAFGFGSGLLPYAPGTWGTLAAIPLYLILSALSTPYYACIAFLLFLVGIVFSQKVSNDLGVEDYSGIVWDEVVGYLLTMLAVPFHWLWIVLGFFLFRLFDIWKPFPIRLIDKHVPGGLGVMLDDVLAALPCWLILQTLVWIVS